MRLACCVTEGGRFGEDLAVVVALVLGSVSELDTVAVDAVPAEPGVEDREGAGVVATTTTEDVATARGLRCARAITVAFRLCSALLTGCLVDVGDDRFGSKN